MPVTCRFILEYIKKSLKCAYVDTGSSASFISQCFKDMRLDAREIQDLNKNK
jgi:hypothetical protein